MICQHWIRYTIGPQLYNQYCNMTLPVRKSVSYVVKGDHHKMPILFQSTFLYKDCKIIMNVQHLMIHSHISSSLYNAMLILNIFNSIPSALLWNIDNTIPFCKPQALEHCTMPLLIYQSILCVMWCRILNDVVQLCNLVLMACTKAQFSSTLGVLNLIWKI